MTAAAVLRAQTDHLQPAASFWLSTARTFTLGALIGFGGLGLAELLLRAAA